MYPLNSLEKFVSVMGTFLVFSEFNISLQLFETSVKRFVLFHIYRICELVLHYLTRKNIRTRS